MKKISISIPTYNREKFLKKLINSISEEINIHISDNGSYIKDSFNKNNISIKSHKKIYSMFENWNLSITDSPNCDFIAITSDDDLYIPNSFDFIQDIIDSEDADIFIFGNYFIDENDNIIGEYCPKEYKVYEAPAGLCEFLYGVDARMPSVFFKKIFLDKIGYFDEENFTLTAADSELIQRALLLGKVAFIPKVVSSYRIWSGSLTDQKIATEHWMDEIEIWTDKIITLANISLEKSQNNFDWNKYKDEIYARNLLGGLSNLYKSKQYAKVLMHYKSTRYPKFALFRTKIRIFKFLILSNIKYLYAQEGLTNDKANIK